MLKNYIRILVKCTQLKRGPASTPRGSEIVLFVSDYVFSPEWFINSTAEHARMCVCVKAV